MTERIRIRASELRPGDVTAGSHQEVVQVSRSRNYPQQMLLNVRLSDGRHVQRRYNRSTTMTVLRTEDA